MSVRLFLHSSTSVLSLLTEDGGGEVPGSLSWILGLEKKFSILVFVLERKLCFVKRFVIIISSYWSKQISTGGGSLFEESFMNGRKIVSNFSFESNPISLDGA